MNKGIILAIALFTLFSAHLRGQNFLEKLNALPPSIVVRAPEFDIEKKFIFSIDSINKVLIIQELRRSPDTKEFNIDQIVYEISLNDLSAGSFRVSKNPADKTLLKFKIGTINNKLSIIQYFLRYDEVVLIQKQDIIELGPWHYSEQLDSAFRKIIPMIGANLSDKSYSTNLFREPRIVFKYYTDRVVGIHSIDSFKAFKDGYYYAASLKNPPSYSKKDNSSNERLLRNIKSEIKRIDIPRQERNPVFIRIDSNGELESIYFPDLSMADNKKIELKNFDHFYPGNDSVANVKSKLLLILK